MYKRQVKCRKVGAANWGNSTKKEEYVPEGKMQDAAINTINKAADFVQNTKNPILRKTFDLFKVKGGKNTPTEKEYKDQVQKNSYEYEKSDWRQELDEKCWPGYEKKGMKTMFGTRYPNCVKKSKKKK